MRFGTHRRAEGSLTATQADAARAAESTGSGLGLPITKTIIERHGGTIGVTSQPGRTTFTILLPQYSAI